MPKRISGFAFFVAATLAPMVASAQDSAVTAEALFQKGHQLFEEKRFAEACPKFAESFRLDPATGSLLALASCHEAEGKLASAWAEYLDVAGRARREGRADRADAAQQRAAQLEPKLAKVSIALAPGADAIAGLGVKRDGIPVGHGMFGTALPVDRGEHTIEASAPGREPFSKRVTIADGASETVAIPVLSESAQAEGAPQPGHPGSSQPAAGGLPLRTIGIATGAVGLVVVGVGGYFGLQAISKNSDSNANGHCVADACDPTGKQARLDAVSAGNTSTVLFVVGGVLAASGVVLFIVGGSSGAGESKPAVAAGPAVGAGAAGFSMSGRF